jgi:hypothetical protein
VTERPDCRLGQLQRGRGAALADPESARPEVVSCVLQNLGRPSYYGELIARIRCPIEAILARVREDPEDDDSVRVLAEAAPPCGTLRRKGDLPLGPGSGS